MEKKILYLAIMLFLLLISSIASIRCKRDDVLFLGAKWGAEEVDYIATPGSINVITVYITPTLANGLKDIIAELHLPKPLTGLNGGSIVKTSHMEFVPKGQILPLTFKVIVPLNTPEGNYTFRLKIKYTILAPLPEERKWEVEFSLPISGRTYVYTELLTEKLEKGKVQNINFNVVYVGNEPVELNIDFQSDALSILDYEPKAPILTDKPGSFEASAKVYCPPDVQVNGLPITITVTYKTLQASGTYTKTYIIPLARKAEVVFTEVQYTTSGSSVIIRGQLVNVGDYDAKYLTVYAQALSEGLTIENPTTYLGTLAAGEGTSFLIYASAERIGKYGLKLSAKYYGPDMEWHETTEEISIEITGIAEEKEKITPIKYEEILPIIIGLPVVTLIIGFIMGRYTRWKSA